MKKEIFDNAVAAINEYHQQDPSTEVFDNKVIASELLYAQRMAEIMSIYEPQASNTLKLASWCHHIKRWEVARSLYPMDKLGYFKWRKHVLQHQISIIEEVLAKSKIDESDIEQVTTYVSKENRKTVPEAQIIEDVACAVFVKYYLEPFAEKHSPEKVTDIIRKTMIKVSERGQTFITQMSLSERVLELIS